MISQDAFLASVEAFLTDTGMSPTALGKEALGDPTFVFELRKGRSCSLAVAGRVEGFMAGRRAGLRQAGSKPTRKAG